MQTHLDRPITRFTRILTALLLAAACTPVQARNWDRQAVPNLAYDIDGSNCESLTCYGREAALAAHAAGLLSVIIVRDAEDCMELARTGQTLICQVGKRYQMYDAPDNVEVQPDGTLAYRALTRSVIQCAAGVGFCWCAMRTRGPHCRPPSPR